MGYRWSYYFWYEKKICGIEVFIYDNFNLNLFDMFFSVNIYVK